VSNDLKPATGHYAGLAERLNSLLDQFSGVFEGDKGGRGLMLEKLTGYSQSTWSLWLSGKQPVPHLKSLDEAIHRIAEEIGYGHKSKLLMAWLLFGPEVVPNPITGTATDPIDHYYRCQLNIAMNQAMDSLHFKFADFTKQQINRIYERAITEFYTGKFDPDSQDTKLQIVKIIADELIGKKP